MTALNDIAREPQVFEVKGRLFTPLTASELDRALRGDLCFTVHEVAGQPCRLVGFATPPPPLPAMLICEGRCNHGIRDVDRVVSREYAQYGRLSPRARALLRGLKHTAHEPLPDGRYVCLACRRIRTCGGGA